MRVLALFPAAVLARRRAMTRTPEDKFRAKVLEALHGRKVRPIEKDILLCLWGYMRCFGGAAWPSHDTIADRVGCSVRTVKRALMRLRGLGWVDWQHRYQKEGPRMVQCSNLYSLSVPMVQCSNMFPVSSECQNGLRNCKQFLKRGIEKKNNVDYVNHGDKSEEDAEIAAIKRGIDDVDNTGTTFNNVDNFKESAWDRQNAQEALRLVRERRQAVITEQWYREKAARQQRLADRGVGARQGSSGSERR
jgi:Helix-turn-helix domain